MSSANPNAHQVPFQANCRHAREEVFGLGVNCGIGSRLLSREEMTAQQTVLPRPGGRPSVGLFHFIRLLCGYLQ
jgi:hypothetical protein